MGSHGSFPTEVNTLLSGFFFFYFREKKQFEFKTGKCINTACTTNISKPF